MILDWGGWNEHFLVGRLPEPRSCDASLNQEGVCGLMEYKILDDATTEGLSVKVNELIMLEYGWARWRPMGGLVVVVNPVKSSRFVQAMIRDDEAEAKPTDMVMMSDMVELNEQILTAARINDGEALAKMSEQIDALIWHAKAND